MDINKGFQLTKPDIFIPWGISEEHLTFLLKNVDLKHVTQGYYTANLTSLDSLNCMIGFHFNQSGNLYEFEFFRKNYDDQKASFEEFQNYFETAFGKPTSFSEGSEGFNDYMWLFDDVKIIHLVYNRYGPEEHMRIRKN